MKELGIKMPEGFLKIVKKKLVCELDNGQKFEIELSGTQISTIFTALGLRFESSAYDEYDDKYLAEAIIPAINTLNSFQAALRLQMSPKEIRKLCAAGKLDCEQHGSDFVVSRMSVELFRKGMLNKDDLDFNEDEPLD